MAAFRASSHLCAKSRWTGASCACQRARRQKIESRIFCKANGPWRQGQQTCMSLLSHNKNLNRGIRMAFFYSARNFFRQNRRKPRT